MSQTIYTPFLQIQPNFQPIQSSSDTIYLIALLCSLPNFQSLETLGGHADLSFLVHLSIEKHFRSFNVKPKKSDVYFQMDELIPYSSLMNFSDRTISFARVFKPGKDYDHSKSPYVYVSVTHGDPKLIVVIESDGSMSYSTQSGSIKTDTYYGPFVLTTIDLNRDTIVKNYPTTELVVDNLGKLYPAISEEVERQKLINHEITHQVIPDISRRIEDIYITKPWMADIEANNNGSDPNSGSGRNYVFHDYGLTNDLFKYATTGFVGLHSNGRFQNSHPSVKLVNVYDVIQPDSVIPMGTISYKSNKHFGGEILQRYVSSDDDVEVVDFIRHSSRSISPTVRFITYKSNNKYHNEARTITNVIFFGGLRYTV